MAFRVAAAFARRWRLCPRQSSVPWRRPSLADDRCLLAEFTGKRSEGNPPLIPETWKFRSGLRGEDVNTACAGRGDVAAGAGIEPLYRAVGASISSPLKSTLKERSIPVRDPVMYDSDTKSPLAPIEPNSYTWGVTPVFRNLSMRRMSSRRMPDAPCKCELIRKSIAPHGAWTRRKTASLCDCPRLRFCLISQKMVIKNERLCFCVGMLYSYLACTVFRKVFEAA